VAVESTAEMRDAVAAALPSADVCVMAAAPADFGAREAADVKIKKQHAPDSIALVRTPDILADTRSARKPGAIVIGFALETNDVIENAASKLAAKGLDAIVANDATESGAGFAVDTNRVAILTRDGAREDLPLMAKSDVADALLDRVEKMIDGR